MRANIALTLIVLVCPQWVWAGDNGKPFVRSDKNRHGLPHIVGGVEVKPHSHPHQVALEMVSGDEEGGVCAGCLISDRWVLTAAHCVDSSNTSVVAVLGAHKYGTEENTTQSAGVEKIIIHPEWNRRAMIHDIALLKLNISVRIDGKNVDVIQLPKASQKDWSFWSYQATMTGWGKEKDEEFPIVGNSTFSVLRSTTSRVVSNFYCGIRYYFISVKIIDSHLCTSGWWAKGTCHGDSGGPLITEDSDGQRILLGVTSFGHFKCEAWWPSVFTRVTSYLDWIYKTSGIAVRQ